jgi:hypothetical protein
MGRGESSDNDLNEVEGSCVNQPQMRKTDGLGPERRRKANIFPDKFISIHTDRRTASGPTNGSRYVFFFIPIKACRPHLPSR